jgi:hypothetical protein
VDGELVPAYERLCKPVVDKNDVTRTKTFYGTPDFVNLLSSLIGT